MQFFMIDSRLTVIKNKKQCDLILDKLSKDNILTYSIEGKKSITKVAILPDDNNEGYFLVYYFEKEIEWFTPAFQMKREEAVNVLWKDRKYYNLKFKD